MNKFFIFLGVALFNLVSFADTEFQTDCKIMAESYVSDVDATAPAMFMGQTREGESVFHVKALVHGKKSIFEVVLKPAECDFVSLRSL